jgi:hypothetical protein
MYSYLEVVDRSLANFTGPKCDQLIQQATNQIEQMLQTSTGQKQVASKYYYKALRRAFALKP